MKKEIITASKQLQALAFLFDRLLFKALLLFLVSWCLLA
jgi:hypothetical protein